MFVVSLVAVVARDFALASVHHSFLGAVTYLNGTSFKGVWEMDRMRGKGRYTLESCASSASKKSAKAVTLRVFGY